MTTQSFICQPKYRRCLLPSLTLLWVLTLVLGLIQPAQAATPGKVIGWGEGAFGRLNIPAGLSDVVAVTGGYLHSLALKGDGTVVAWGDNSDGQLNIPAGLSDVVAVAGGRDHSLALKGDGTVVAWGSNSDGQLNIPAGLSDVVAIGAGDYHSLAVKGDGTVVAWGYNFLGQLNIPAGLSDVVAVTGGFGHSLALKGDGTVVIWGNNDYGQLNIPAGLDNVIAIGAGEIHSVALKGDGTVVAWGANYDGQLNIPAGLNSVVAIAVGYADNVALKADGTVVHWGRNRDGAFNVPAGLRGVVGIGMGNDVILAILETTPPVVTVTGVSNGAVYNLGSVPTAGCNTTDAFAGVATPATVSLTGGNPDGSGSFTATCSGATDKAGNTANPVSVTYTVNPPPDSTAPFITPSVVGTLGNNSWYVSNVSVSWSVVDAESAISNQSGCDPVTVNSDSAGITFTCTATSNGGSSSQSVTLKRDTTAPTISAGASSVANANGWYNSNVTVQFTCNDNLSGVVSCPVNEMLSNEGSAVSSTTQTISDQAGNSSATSNVVTVQLDKTAPVVTVIGVSNGAAYTVGSVPAAGCSSSDALSGMATQATVNSTGGNPDGTGAFTATCSGATDKAGNTANPVSVSYTVSAPVDACTTTALRDNFNRANGGLGSNWAGLTSQSFYKIANNQVDVQLGGPVVWKPTTFGVNQAAFVTLRTLDGASPSQGLLLKVQGSTIPTGGAIAVVYDNLAKAVRVSTLRLNTLTWTTYGNTPATFVNGDKLLGCVKADGTVRVYQNNTLLTTVTLNAADRGFFNAKGGKIGLWTVAAFNAFVDDFGGGVLTSVTAATLDANAVPDELADDGTEITVAADFPTDAAVAAPDADAFANRLFLPLVSR